MTPPLITSADDVTAEWLTAVLEEGGVARGAVVESIDVTPVGTGQMGENARFALSWSDAEDRPTAVVGKFPSNDPISRATATGGGSYAREVAFYRDTASTVSIRTPRCYHADVDLESGLFVLVMEDLAPAEQGDQLAGCSVDVADLVMDELAGLQVPRWNDASLRSSEWITQRFDGPSTLVELYAMVIDGFMERIGGRLEPDAQELVVRLGSRLREWSANTPLDHRVLCHGDFRLDNMMFGEIGPTRDPVAVVDWQTVSHGVPGTDLSYFIGAGLLPDDRRTHERDLVRGYHERLRAAGIEGFDFDACWNAYVRGAFEGIIMAVVASQIVVQTDRGDEMFFVMAERHSRQALDLGSEAAI